MKTAEKELKACRSYLLAEIINAEISEHPFSHTYIENFFPVELFAAILNAIPAKEHFKPIRKLAAYQTKCIRQLGAQGERRDLFIRRLITGKDYKYVSAEKRDFWTRFYHEIMVQEYLSAVVNKFYSPPENRRYRIIPRFVQESGAVFLWPHTDLKYKLVSMVVYLNGGENESHHQGTTLYSPDEDNAGSFDVVKTMPFKPNSCSIIPRYDKSYHGVEPYVCGTERKTLHLYVVDEESEIW